MDERGDAKVLGGGLVSVPDAGEHASSVSKLSLVERMESRVKPICSPPSSLADQQIGLLLYR